ncbi:V-type proton ATPase subunit S1 [Dermacentor albipictus]|uniref:V-type proton ATPase subunit S1 n=1 Tax=Dermacentor albipictus TaxID=60249 RepID=UPI0031FDDF29
MAVACLYRRLAVVVLLAFTVYSSVLSANVEVPAYIWGSESGLKKIPQVGSFDKVEPSAFGNSVANLVAQENAVVVAFVQDKLSAEDLSRASSDDRSYKYLKDAFGKEHVLVLPAVENPVDALTSHGGLRVTHLNIPDVGAVQSALDGLHDGSQVLLVDLPRTVGVESRSSALQQADTIMEATMQALSSGGKKLFGLYTGRDLASPMVEAAHLSRSRRHLLAMPEAAPSSNETAGVIMVRSGCLLMYGRTVTVSFTEDPKAATFTTVTYNDTLSPPPVPQCSSDNQHANITLKFPDSGPVKDFSLLMVFKSDERGGFALTEMNATLKNYQDLQMRVKDLWWPRGFSFSCSLSQFRQYNSTKLPQLHLQLDTFQVQLVQNNTGQFSESYDCAGFFTTVIWMGLLVVLLYLIILGTGVFFIYDIRTNDRFDDPKGKTITVTASD